MQECVLLIALAKNEPLNDFQILHTHKHTLNYNTLLAIDLSGSSQPSGVTK